ncbi:MAG: methylcobalamin:coenzyme M methyltransferase [Syntrophorhabdus sp. PtaU1.Bin058]|nr:MAG: methylcobalamin:coenzyme M methyltransferase [Syntrophorhabdus sp. PtaU1.Bin058]
METDKDSKMTSAERMKALFEGRRPDRVPFNPFAIGFCAGIVGFEIADMYSDPRKSFEAQLMTRELYGYDANPVYAYASQGGWELGGEIKFPTGNAQAPVVSNAPVKTIEDIERLEMPDVSQAGALPLMMEFARLQSDKGMASALYFGTPFKLAANAMELPRMARLMIKEPNYVHKLVRKTTDFTIKAISYWIEVFGAEKVIYMDGAPTEANQIMSAKQFETFSLPYIIEVHERALFMGVKRFSTHVCGEQNLNLELWQKVPMGDAGIMSFGHEVDLNKVKRMFGDRCIIAGNVEPSRIQLGSPSEVYELCKKAIIDGKDSPRGYIFMPGCELPPDAPPYNIYTMKKAVDDFGSY